MAKGALAKQQLINKVIAAIPEKDFAGESGGKYYFWSEEDGTRMQVCISLTCPKVPFEQIPTMRDGGYDFGAEPSLAAPISKPADFTQEERDNINKLIKNLNL